MTTINLMAGGPAELLPSDWQAGLNPWIGVDRGALRLVQRGITPILSVGDFDSLTLAEREAVQQQSQTVISADAHKDQTDTELAVAAAFTTFAAKHVQVFGATGGRLDHFLANLFLPLAPQFHDHAAQITLRDRQNEIIFATSGELTLTARPDYRYLAIVNLTPVSGLYITGAVYPLVDWSSTQPVSWASNEFDGDRPVQLSWQSGSLAIIFSRDLIGQKMDN